jgi:hypothetical protein
VYYLTNFQRADFELEKAKVKGIQDQKQIKLDVGGVYHFLINTYWNYFITVIIYYTTSISTLTREPQSMLGAMFSGRHELKFNDEGRYFIDRNGEYFGYPRRNVDHVMFFFFFHTP